MDGDLDSTTWTALAITLTVVGAGLTVLAYRRRGLAAGLKGLAWTLVPVALLLTGTLRLVVAIGEDVARWASRLVFSPTVWTGVVVAGVAVVLWVVAGMMTARGIGVRGAAAERAVRKAERVRGAVGAPGAAAASPAAGTSAPTGRGRGRPAAAPAASRDDDMDEIEAILKKHGI